MTKCNNILLRVVRFSILHRVRFLPVILGVLFMASSARAGDEPNLQPIPQDHDPILVLAAGWPPSSTARVVSFREGIPEYQDILSANYVYVSQIKDSAFLITTTEPPSYYYLVNVVSGEWVLLGGSGSPDGLIFVAFLRLVPNDNVAVFLRYGHVDRAEVVQVNLDTLETTVVHNYPNTDELRPFCIPGMGIRQRPKTGGKRRSAYPT